MSHSSTVDAIDLAHTRCAAQMIGMSVALFGYPLVEMVRMCRVQTCSRYERCEAGSIAIDALRHSAYPPVARKTGVRGRRYSSAWLWLHQGARLITSPCEPSVHGTNYHLSFYDAFGQQFADIAHPNARPAGVVLIGPKTARLRDGVDFHTLQSSTHLVWMVGCFENPDDDPEARQFQSRLRINGPLGTINGQRPPAVDLWEGDATDTFVAINERLRPAAELAPSFYANLCRALAHVPVRPHDRALRNRMPTVGLAPNAALDWRALDPAVRIGLTQGLEDAAHMVGEWALSAPFDPDAGNSSHLAGAIHTYRGMGIR